MNQLSDQSINQSINQSVNHSINQSFNQSINQSISQVILHIYNVRVEEMLELKTIIFVCNTLFDILFVSYLEIYNEKVGDLLRPAKGREKYNLKVREHPKEGPYVQGMSWIPLLLISNLIS